MITIIAGTNRKDSNTKKIAQFYKQYLDEKNIDCKLLSLDEVTVFERNTAFETMEADYLTKAEKFIILSPEYNGSFAGVLKLMIDNTDVKAVWPSKKILLTGVSTGRAGNLRGMEHLTSILLHLKANLHYNRLPISSVHTYINEQNEISDEAISKTIKQQIDEFVVY